MGVAPLFLQEPAQKEDKEHSHVDALCGVGFSLQWSFLERRRARVRGEKAAFLHQMQGSVCNVNY
jgi:hypothetical protein